MNAKVKAKIQLVTSHNIDQCYYYKSQLVYTSFNKISNSKDFKIKESKSKFQ